MTESGMDRGEMRRALILEEVGDERRRQDQRWGESHDDEHSLIEWIGLLSLYLGKAADVVMSVSSKGAPGPLRRRLVQIAAVAVAAVEALDRRAVR